METRKNKDKEAARKDNRQEAENHSYECAIMSYLAYDDSWELSKESNKEEYKYKEYMELLIHKGWKRYFNSKESNIGNDNGYFALAFINEEKKLMVISHRGTINHDGNYLADIEISQRTLPKIFYSALEFLFATTKKMIEEGKTGWQIMHTGHSLGGFLAVLCAVSSYKHSTVCSAIAFDNPGTKTASSILLKTCVEHSINEALKGIIVINYLTTPNLINTTDEHIGRIFQLKGYLPLRAQSSYCGFSEKFNLSLTLKKFTELLHTKSTHSMEEILNFFKENKEAELVKKWVVAEYELIYNAPEIACLFAMGDHLFSWQHIILNVIGIEKKIVYSSAEKDISVKEEFSLGQYRSSELLSTFGTMTTSTKKEAELEEARRESLDDLPMEEQANRAVVGEINQEQLERGLAASLKRN